MFMASDCVNGIDAQKVLGYTLCRDGKCIKLPYPLESFHFDVAGRSFHHGRFVQKLREKAASLPKYNFFPFNTCLHISSFLLLLYLFFQCKVEARNSNVSA